MRLVVFVLWVFSSHTLLNGSAHILPMEQEGPPSSDMPRPIRSHCSDPPTVNAKVIALRQAPLPEKPYQLVMESPLLGKQDTTSRP